MKKPIILIFAAAIMLSACSTTKPPAGPSKTMMDHADKIILTVDETPDEAYRNFAGYLSSNDFTFTNSDEVIRVLKTDYKNYEGSSQLQYRVNVNVRKDTVTVIQLTGSGNMSLVGNINAKNKGMNNSPVRNIWGKIVDLAKAYPHTAIYYARN